MQRRLIVLVGSSGAGKSTLAKALQEALLPQQWLHFSPDTLFYCLPQSTIHQVDHHDQWQLVDWKALVKSSYTTVQALLGNDQRVIFDTAVMSQAAADQLAEAFAALDPLFVRITCSWDEIRRRTLERGDRTLEEAERAYKSGAEYFKSDLTVDSTGVSADEIAVGLLRQMPSISSAA